MIEDFKRSRYPFPSELADDLRRQNPWWSGTPLPTPPEFRRWPFERIVRRLDDPLAPILALRGPRQVGKSTLQQQVIQHFLTSGVAPERILRVQVDVLRSLIQIPDAHDPLLRIIDWFEQEVLGQPLNVAGNAGKPALLFFDEVQNLDNWPVQLKHLVDHAPVRVLVTGSSALEIERGRDSLAGRIQTLEIGPLRLVEVAALRGFGTLSPVQTDNGWAAWLEPTFWHAVRAEGIRQAAVRDAAFAAYADRGGYPVLQLQAHLAWDELADYLVETVVNRVIQHDLLIGMRGEPPNPRLVEAVFQLVCRYAGQAPSPTLLSREAHHMLGLTVTPDEVGDTLRGLESSLLVRAIRPLEARLKRSQGHAKLCLADHAIRAAWLQEQVPLDPAALAAHPDLAVLAGHIAESVAGAYLASLYGLDLAHFPERKGEPEVDFVLIIGYRRIPVEVKYQATIDPARDTLGLLRYIEKPSNNATFGLLITRDDATPGVERLGDPRIVGLPLKSLLMVR